MLAFISLISFGLLSLGYRYYSSFLEKNYNISEKETVPSVELNDGYDYYPTNKFVLLGHHFSSIAGAGPIVGPIIAAIYFGWLPALLWIIIGSIFIGGVHDFSSLIISVRHKGKSIAEIANLYVNKTTFKIFLLFIWFALVYVITVFADITADTFAKNISVAEISIAYIIVAVFYGIIRRKYGVKNFYLTVISLIVLVIMIVLSFKYQFIPFPKNMWIYVLLVYAFFASILPVWILLQPRDYLSSYLLYFSVIIGIIGIFLGGYKVSYPSYITFNSQHIGTLFPFLFITIACGAVSGFHSLVSSGTTSKQIDNIKNARFIGYGSMVLEAIVAIIALSTVMILTSTSTYGFQPAVVYANGISAFSKLLSINPETGKVTGLLIISGFLLTTLDTATRIARYIYQEFTEKTNSDMKTKIIATLVSIVLPFILLNIKLKGANGEIIPAWKFVWPVFGTTNQLLAALTLLIIFLWAKKEGIRKLYVILIPAVFMFFTTLTAMLMKLMDFIKHGNINLVFFLTLLLFVFTLFIVYEVVKSLKKS